MAKKKEGLKKEFSAAQLGTFLKILGSIGNKGRTESLDDKIATWFSFQSYYTINEEERVGFLEPALALLDTKDGDTIHIGFRVLTALAKDCPAVRERVLNVLTDIPARARGDEGMVLQAVTAFNRILEDRKGMSSTMVQKTADVFKPLMKHANPAIANNAAFAYGWADASKDRGTKNPELPVINP